MSSRSSTHLVLIPSYNTGPKVLETVRAARAFWDPVWVVVDGSTDGTAEQLTALAQSDPGLTVMVLDRNQGKGAAVLAGLCAAEAQGFSYVLTMDADGQHAPDSIPEFMALSQERPNALVLGLPVFDASAPAIRVRGRRLSNWAANVETLWMGIGDSLFGFRVYPIAPLRSVMASTRWMRRFDFDPEAVIRLCWLGFEPVNLSTPVRYFSTAQGGVSHFRYGRDNLLISWMYARLFCGFLRRLPALARRAVRSSRR